MDRQSKVSVIVPVYNTADYLDECLDSIRLQTYRRLEIIVVDDGSTDSSPEIIARHAADDTRIRVISQPNAGQAAARNAALDVMTGDAVAFVDSDDVLHPDAISFLLGLAVDNGAQVAIGQHVFSQHKPRFKTLSAKCMGALEGEEAAIDTLYQHHILNGPCSKIFDAKLFEGVRFISGLYYEDLEIVFRILLKAQRAVWCNDVIYYYRDNPRSFINTFNRRRLDVLHVTDMICRDVANRGNALRRAADDRRFGACYNMLLLMLAHRHEDDYSDDISLCRQEIRRLRSGRLRDGCSRLKNRLGALLSYGGLPMFKLLSKLLKS